MKAFVILLRACWQYAAGHRGKIVVYLTLFIVANVISMVEPYAVGRLLNQVQEVASLSDPLRQIMESLGLVLLISISFWIFHGPARVMELSVAFHVKNAYRDHVYRIITSLPVQWHRDNHSGRTINRLGKSSRALSEFLGNGFQIIEMLIRLAASIVALALLFPGAAAMASGVSVIALMLVFIFDRFLLRRYNRINEEEHSVAAALHDYITNIFTVITLRLEQLTRSEVLKRMTHYFPFARRTQAVNESKWFLVSVIIAVMKTGVIAWYAVLTIRSGDPLLVGTFFMLYQYLREIGESFYTFAWKYSDTIEQYADYASTAAILRAERTDTRSVGDLPRDWNRIEIKDLKFSYTEEEDLTVAGSDAPAQSSRRLELSVPSIILGRSRKIAFVGESGSGKSTMLALIRGLVTTNDVRLFCDGKAMKRGLKHLSAHVTLIPQEPEIFANTIEYNITVDTKLKKEELLEDIELARFSSVLARLPKGLKTNIAEKGVNLSGGEKQRLALARGIFAAKTSDFILLDEPTSSVDPANERAIYENLFRRFADRCIVSSIHKLHLLPMFEYVYVFTEGKITAEGTPEELMKEGGVLHGVSPGREGSKK
ncbi:MAG: ABC transporter ATP-binding protein [Candidatus Peribacteraceae bacterium]|nr:ABC transporter ATP-binding protein [Candidatus Peribacteraceae bacterium]